MAVARAFDVTPDEAPALTARFLETGRGRPGSGRPRCRTRADPDPERPVVPATSGDRRYTTTELLAAEQRIIGPRPNGSAKDPVGSPPRWSNRCSGCHPHLDGEQADGVRALLTSGNGYDLVIGQAGTGKSTLLEAARIGWEEAGYRVIGTAVAARTAADLEGGTGIPSSSLTQLLADLPRCWRADQPTRDRARRGVHGRQPTSRPSSVPTSMRAGAKLVLVGDNRQLSSIDAGGALRSLSSELGDHVDDLDHEPPSGRR